MLFCPPRRAFDFRIFRIMAAQPCPPNRGKAIFPIPRKLPGPQAGRGLDLFPLAHWTGEGRGEGFWLWPQPRADETR